MQNTFIQFIYNYGLIAIFILILLEYSCFPLPSEIVLVLSGVIAIENNISFFKIFILSVFAGVIGSSICYLLGLTLGNKILLFIEKVLPKSKKGIKEAKNKYQKFSSLSVCVGRLIPLCRTYISFIAGISKQKYIKYLFFSTIGICFWNFCLIFLGYKFYQNIDFVFKIYNNYKYIILFILSFLLILYIIFRVIKKNKYHFQ